MLFAMYSDNIPLLFYRGDTVEQAKHWMCEGMDDYTATAILADSSFVCVPILDIGTLTNVLDRAAAKVPCIDRMATKDYGFKVDFDVSF